MIEDYARRLQSQGISFDQYLQFTGMHHGADYRSRCVRRLS